MSDVVYMSEAINAIREKYPDSCHSNEEIAELKTLWGGGDTNHCGVFHDFEEISIPCGEKRQAFINLAQAGNGLFVYSTAYQQYYGDYNGYGYAPSVYNHLGFKTRQAAYDAGMRELDKYLPKKEIPAQMDLFAESKEQEGRE